MKNTIRLLLFISACFIFSLFLNSSALADDKGYGCVKHKLAVFGRSACPIDNAPLSPIEEWISICPVTGATAVIKGPKYVGFDEACGKTLIPAYTFYSCPEKPDVTAFRKDKLQCVAKKEPLRKRIEARWYCKKHNIWFADPGKKFTCPIGDEPLLYDRDQEL